MALLFCLMGKGASLSAARASKEAARRQVATEAEVVGVGIVKAKRGGGFAVKVNVKAAPLNALPAEVEGVPIVIEVIGTVRKR